MSKHNKATERVKGALNLHTAPYYKRILLTQLKNWPEFCIGLITFLRLRRPLLLQGRFDK